jgi:hypothetical protein
MTIEQVSGWNFTARDAGVTWMEIGLALGVSPQGARQR